MLAKPLASALALGLLFALTPLAVDSARATDGDETNSSSPSITSGGRDGSAGGGSSEDQNSDQLTEAQKRAAELKKQAEERAAEAARQVAEANREAAKRAAKEQAAAALASKQAAQAAKAATNNAKRLAREAARKKAKAANSRVSGTETQEGQDEAETAANEAEAAQAKAERAARRAAAFEQLAADTKHSEIETKYGRISSFSLPPLLIKQSNSTNITSASTGNRVIIPGSITPDPLPTDKGGSSDSTESSKTSFVVSAIDVTKHQISASASDATDSISPANELYKIYPQANSAVSVSAIKISRATPADDFMEAAYWSLGALALATGSLLLGAGVSSLRSRRQD